MGCSLADLLVGSSFPRLKHLTLQTIASTEPANRSFAEQVIDNPLELERIAAALKNRTVQRKPFSLELKALGVDSAGIKALAAQPVLAGISGLSFIFSALSDEDVAILAALDRPFKGFELHLGKIGFAGAVALSQAAWLTMLSELILPNQDIGDAGMAEVIDKLDGSKIEMLILRYNQLGEKTANVLSKVSLPHLKILELSYNLELKDEAIAAIISNLSFSNLEILQLLGTGTSRSSTQAIARANHLVKLRVLELGDNVGDRAAIQLLNADLRSLQRLKLVGVSDKAISKLELPERYVTNRMFG